MRLKPGGLFTKKEKIIAMDITLLNGKNCFRFTNVEGEVLDYVESLLSAQRVQGRWFKFWFHLENKIPVVENQINSNLKEINIWLSPEETARLRDFLNSQLPKEQKTGASCI